MGSCLVCLLGRPGSGKTSAARPVAERDDVSFVRVSDLLKEEAESGLRAEELRKQMERGDLVESDLVRGVVSDHVRGAQAPLVILDGFPRTEDQIEALDRIARSTGRQLSLILVLALPREMAERRLTGRRVCSRCGEIYNVHYDPPPEDACRCGGELERREDDRPEVVRDRQDRFDRTTRPVIRSFSRHRGDLLRCVRAGGAPEEVQDEVLRILDHRCPGLDLEETTTHRPEGGRE